MTTNVTTHVHTVVLASSPIVETYHTLNLTDELCSTLHTPLQGVLHLSERSSNEGTVKWHIPAALYYCSVTVSRFGSH